MTALRALVAIALSLLAALAGAQERVSFPSFDGAGNAPVVLSGYFFPAATSPAPAIAMFHGCGGAYDKRGELSRRLREYAELFNGLGLHVLVVDSLTARYEKELCTQRNGTRRVTQANRRLDALGAIAYLADRAERVEAAVGLRHTPRASALSAELLLVARGQRIDDEHVHAEAVEKVGVLAHAAAELAALVVGAAAAVEHRDRRRRRRRRGEEIAAQHDGRVAGTVEARKGDALLRTCQRRQQRRDDRNHRAQCGHAGSPPATSTAAGGSGCRRAIAKAST